MSAGFNTSESIDYSKSCYLEMLLGGSIIAKPGAKFTYDSSLYVLLAYILQYVKEFDRYYYSKILATLSIFVELMSITIDGLILGSRGMTMGIDDVAKIGYLYLNNGTWNKKKLITEEWIDESLDKQIAVNDSLYFGYSWLINDQLGCYSAGGFSNDQLFIIPEENTIFVIFSREYSESYLKQYYYIIENILFNEEYKTILAFAYGIPFTMSVLVIMIVISIREKSKKKIK